MDEHYRMVDEHEFVWDEYAVRIKKIPCSVWTVHIHGARMFNSYSFKRCTDWVQTRIDSGLLLPPDDSHRLGKQEQTTI